MPRVFFPLVLFLFCVGCGGSNKIKGEAPKGEPRTILAIKAGDTPSTTTLRGVIIEKCPTAGCWFRLQDETGVIKVDTKAAGFVILDLPLQTKVTVGGKINSSGEEAFIEATGLQY